ncbi:MAG: hypothetical protein R3C56_20660 [Pirellulaceae bacterium]
MSEPHYELEIETLHTASRFQVERVTQRFPDGRCFTREVVRHRGAVVIVPVLDDGRICMIRNYRVAIDQQLPSCQPEPWKSANHPLKRHDVS